VTLVPRARRATDRAARKVFPDHWSFLLGEIAMVALFVLFATGIVLAFLYDASGEATTYDGSYHPLRGVEMSRAYESVVRISFDVPAGLLLRQVHHWTALVFVAAIVVHAARIFFTGAYRRPRRVNYLIGLTLLVVSVANGFFGVALPDDLLSGSGAQIGHAIALSVPVLGPGIASALVGGEFASEEMVHRFWLIHVFAIPTIIVALFSVHMALVWRQTHTQYPTDGAAGEVVGTRLLPHHAMKTGALLLSMVAVLVGMGALLQINPVWQHGPFQPAAATVPAGPDWYLMFVEGGLRILPALHLSLGPVEIPSPFLAGVAVPALVFATLAAWPFVEERLQGDRHLHHLLERPRDRPGRTAFGVAGLSFLAVLTLAANHDYLGGVLGIDVVAMTTAFRALLVVAPLLAGALAWRLARDLAEGNRPAEQTGPGPEAAS
jgi:ubiquinol-cytochrome c reductase cytochrome b subunit